MKLNSVFSTAVKLLGVTMVVLSWSGSAAEAQSTGRCVVPPSGMVSWWPGDGHAQDIAGNNHGTPQNGATFAVGLVSSAFDLDGVDDYIFVPAHSSLVLEKLTIDFWFKPKFTFDHSVSTSPRFFAKGYSFSGDFPAGCCSVNLANNDGRLEVVGPNPRPNSVRNTWLAGTWYHIAVTFDGSLYKVFVDGGAEGSIASNVSILNNAFADNITLGGLPGFASTFVDGLLDEVQVYDRALSPAEIAAIHGAGAAGKCKRRVAIDIKPGSDPNSIRKGSAGVIPVAVLGAADFNPATINPATLDLAGAGVKLVGKNEKPLCHLEDVNGDGLADLVCQVQTWEFLVEEGASTAVLRARTYTGDWVWGEDSIRIVP